ncbi:MAG: ImmA/IrrE family metallo-endopeptidase [Planctomycetes bacterium]|nr:ImmA/IrrE family metallo-endopeptidase [Planctomycetota bacterium]
MSTPLWVWELASDFWSLAGKPEPFPRQLRSAVSRALPVRILSITGLRVAGVLAWLSARDIVCDMNEADRRLRACLVARNGDGFIFLDASDDADEQRFSLAHEIAHFLRDYRQPRRRAERLLGRRVLEVHDGIRPPEPGERLHALLAGVPVGFHTHLLARDRDGRAEGAAATAEREADRLAWELLAPTDEVLARSSGDRDPRRAATATLREFFVLPAAQAERYAAVLHPPAPRGDPLLTRLRAAARKSVELRPSAPE